jgi:hypothetical protein
MDFIFTFMRDASWGFISAALALAALIVAVWAARRRHIKELRFQRFSDRLVGVKNDMGGRLKLLFDGKQISNLWFVRYQFQNTGAETILASDFERPISFVLIGGGGREVLQASIEAH